jgi:predicted DNA-binding transcriptional regulator AlpA
MSAPAEQAERETFTIDEVATKLGLSRSYAYLLAGRDALPVPVLRVGGRLLVPRRPLERLLDGEREAIASG